MMSLSGNCEDMKDGASCLREKEVSEPIETNKLSVEFSSRVKISDPEEEDEEDSESECCSSDKEEEEEDIETEWDIDSYDGCEYYSYESENSDEEEKLKWRRYKRMLIETKGFFVDPNIRPAYRQIIPLTDMDNPYVKYHDFPARDFFSELASECLEKLNQRRGSSVKFEQLLWVNYRGGSGGYRGGSGPCFYITFLAKEFESPDTPPVEYQAKVVYTFLRKTYPILCRPSPDPRWMREMLKKITTPTRNGVEDETQP